MLRGCAVTAIEMMNLAEKLALRSVCKRAQVGAVVTHEGYYYEGWNHAADYGVCECAEGKTLPTVIHAEGAAIAELKRCVKRTRGAVLYVTRQPCIHCARLITAAGISKVYYRDADDKDWGLRWLAWHGVEVDSGWILGQVQRDWAERNGVVG